MKQGSKVLAMCTLYYAGGDGWMDVFLKKAAPTHTEVRNSLDVNPESTQIDVFRIFLELQG